jgi:hypothetical protein
MNDNLPIGKKVSHTFGVLLSDDGLNSWEYTFSMSGRCRAFLAENLELSCLAPAY